MLEGNNAPRADDRKNGEFDGSENVDFTTLEGRFDGVLGGQVTTAKALEALWADRDTLYEGQATALDNEAIARVRAFRVLEVRNLPADEQVSSRLASRAMTWTPPR